MPTIYELEKPFKSSIHAGWEVWVVNHPDLLLLADSTISCSVVPTGVYIFKTELMAHFAAANYYNQSYGRNYPYIVRLIELCDEVSTFEPLELPEDTDGGLWVITVQSPEYRQLHDNAVIYDGVHGDGRNDASAFFNSEELAIDAAVEYYHAHGRNYFEYEPQPTTEGSLVMRFE